MEQVKTRCSMAPHRFSLVRSLPVALDATRYTDATSMDRCPVRNPDRPIPAIAREPHPLAIKSDSKPENSGAASMKFRRPKHVAAAPDATSRLPSATH